ncbi:MAG: AMP-binding protein [Prevotella sp.]|nr:AMP-binding protein [Alistipes senegalensis]MCM1357265.1 AMP-binding protein [Prevotella sp.]MCM1474087.1 AMP-binding protein [Muribaculaceae bacterium]
MSNSVNPEFKIREVAQRIKAVRESVGLTSEEMAEKTGVSVYEYLAYEGGAKDFSFTFIYKFANATGVEITDLMEGESPKIYSYDITRKGGGLPIIRRKGLSYMRLAPNFRNKIGEPFLVTIPYVDEQYRVPHPHTHEGQELDIVVSGQLKVRIGDNEEILNEGDSIYYDSGEPHDEWAVGGKDCKFYAVVFGVNQPHSALQNLDPVLLPGVTNFDLANVENPVIDKFVQTETDENGALSKITFTNEETFNFGFDIVDKLAEKSPDKTALIYVSDDMEERRFTFAEIKKYSNMTANYFLSKGIKKGDTVMLVLKRHYQFWFSIIALHKIGAIVIPATHQLVQHDFTYRFKAADVKAIVCTAENDAAYQAELAIEECGMDIKKIVANGERDGWDSFDKEMYSFSDVFERPEDPEILSCGSEPMLMFFTSGTTGYPKIAMHSHKYALGHFITARYWHNVDPNGIHLTISDTGWGKALWGKLYGQWMSETCVFVYDFNRFDANKILPMFKKYNITTFCAPPTMYRFFIKEDLSKFDLSSIKYATVAGEALNPEVYNQFLKATGIKLMEGFGQTETTLAIGNFVGMTAKPGSMGKPSVLYDIDIVDPDGNSVKTGETGEIVIKVGEKAPCGLFMEYYRDSEKTKEVWYDGMYHTGDTAWRDEDGYFWYVGRVDDVIKSSGYRIGPFEIESVIMELPYVVEVGVSAAPDPVRGQVVKASIVLTKGTVGTDELKKEIQDYVKKHTAPYKYPRIVEFRDELPKTISGKIRRVELKG